MPGARPMKPRVEEDTRPQARQLALSQLADRQLSRGSLLKDQPSGLQLAAPKLAVCQLSIDPGHTPLGVKPGKPEEAELEDTPLSLVPPAEAEAGGDQGVPRGRPCKVPRGMGEGQDQDQEWEEEEADADDSLALSANVVRDRQKGSDRHRFGPEGYQWRKYSHKLLSGSNVKR